MDKSSANTLTLTANQVWILNTIQMVLSMLLKVSQARTVQIIGKMGHSERYEDGLFKNIPGNKEQHLFASAVKYFTGK